MQIDLQFINTADESRYGKVMNEAHPDPDYFIAVYDTTDLESLNYINISINQIRRNFRTKKSFCWHQLDTTKPTCVTEEMIDVITLSHKHYLSLLCSNAAIPAKDTAEFISQKMHRIYWIAAHYQTIIPRPNL